MELDYSVKPAGLGRRINWRLTTFLTVCCGACALVLFMIARETLSGGVINHGNYAEVNLKALGQFPFDQAEGRLTDVPSQYRALDGRRVSLDGFMYADLSSASSNKCQLVWNIQKCCFSGPPQVQERVFMHAPPGQKLKYYDYGTMVRVIGTLHVGIKKADGTITSVYELVPDSIVPVQ